MVCNIVLHVSVDILGGTAAAAPPPSGLAPLPSVGAVP